jgi:hypothetical protein
VNGGKKGENQGIEGSANADNVWIWMRLDAGFCNTGKCDLFSFFLSFDRISPSSLYFIILFLLLKHGASSYEVSPLLLFNPCSPFFLRILLFAGKRFHSLDFSRRITG